MFLNSRAPFDAYRATASGRYFVDKTELIAELIPALKIDSTPEEAIRQIKDKKYALRFKGKLGEKSKYTGRILAVGISYHKKTKVHSCRVEIL